MRRLVEPVHDPDAHEEFATLRVIGGAELIIRTAAMVVNVTARTVTVEGRSVWPSPREWLALVYLADARGGYRTVKQLIQATDPDLPPPYSYSSLHALRIMLRRLRWCLGPCGVLIETQVNVGYRLAILPPVEVMPLLPPKPWAQKWPCCRGCGSTERQHEGGGYCGSCRMHMRGKARRS